LLVTDATASYFPEFKEATLSMVRAQNGIVGWTANAEQVRQTLHRVYASPEGNPSYKSTGRQFKAKL
jgi:hypothetical protein